MSSGRVGRVLMALAAALALCGVPRVARGHAFAPAVLDIRETAPGQASVRWKEPVARALGSELRPILPGSCQRIGDSTTLREDLGVVVTFDVSCPGGLPGKAVEVEGIEGSGASAVVRVALADGRSVRAILSSAHSSLVIPERESLIRVVRDYGQLGIQHILGGFDHLLFVFGLVLLVGGGWRLLKTVTAFTVGHSATLALAVLGFVHMPQALIEAAIALTIYVLGVDLARGSDGRPSLLRRWPWPMAGLFGLLHGLGFAGALSKVGLPDGEVPLALFAFNGGIEIGQLVFIACVLAVWEGLRRVPVPWPSYASRVPAYGIATMACFWFLERARPIVQNADLVGGLPR